MCEWSSHRVVTPREGFNMNRIHALFLAAGSVLSICCHHASSQQVTKTWIGPANGLWGTSANWTPLGVPNNGGGMSYIVIIPNNELPRLDMTATIDKMGIAPSAVMSIANGHTLTILGQSDNLGFTGLLSNEGTLYLGGVNNFTQLLIGGGAGHFLVHGNINGTPARIYLSDYFNNRIFGANGTEKLILQHMSRVHGSGQLGVNSLEIDNAGVVEGEGTVGLYIDPNGNGMRNSGTIRAELGPVYLQPGTYNNSGGLLIALAGRVMTLNNARIDGGTMTTSSDSSIDAITNSVLNGTTINGNVRVINGNACYIEGLNWLGVAPTRLRLDGINNLTSLISQGPVTLRGPGQVEMSDYINNRIYSASGTDHISLIDGASIRGSGNVCLNAASISISPSSIIEAIGSAGMTIDPNANGLLNNGALQAASGSTLLLLNGTFMNDGYIRALNGGIVRMSGVLLIGGTLDHAGSGFFIAESNTELRNIGSISPVHVPNGHTIFLRGTFNSNGLLGDGSLELNGTNNFTQVSIRGDVSLTGQGDVLLSNYFNNRIYAENGVDRLTNQDNTIRGSGQIGVNAMAFTNNSTVEASGSVGLTFDVNAGGLDNNGVIRALSGSSLTFTGSSIDNTDGSIELQNNSSGTISGCVITGGPLNGLGNGMYTTHTSSEFNMVIGNAPVSVLNGHTLFLRNGYTNNSALRLDGVNNFTQAHIRGNMTISGPGVMLMTNYFNNRIHAENGLDRLTNAAGHTIRGSGQIGVNSMAFTNNGLCEADGSVGLTFDANASGIDNNGVIRALSGSSLTFSNTPIDNADGVIELMNNSSGTFAASVLTGGPLNGASNSSYSVVSSTEFNTVTCNATVSVPNGNNFYLRGGLTNNSSLRLDGFNNFTQMVIRGGDVSIGGSGQLILAEYTNNRIHAENGVDRLINLPGHTIRGGGQIGINSMAFTNRGSVIAEGAVSLGIDPNAGGFFNEGLLRASGAGGLLIHAGPFTTSGTVIADPGSKLDRTADNWVQTGGMVMANGEIEVDNNTYMLQGGVLGGSGLVDSNVINSGGDCSPGASPGLLTIEGNYTQQAGGMLTIELGGTMPGSGHDQLAVLGNAALNGRLRVLTTNSYIPPNGQTFTILTTTGTRSGTFNLVTPPIGHSVSVAYLSSSVVITLSDECVADVDDGSMSGARDGGVTIDDLLYYLSIFDLGLIEADVDDGTFTGGHDGGVTIDDLLYYLFRFDSGC